MQLVSLTLNLLVSRLITRRDTRMREAEGGTTCERPLRASRSRNDRDRGHVYARYRACRCDTHVGGKSVTRHACEALRAHVRCNGNVRRRRAQKGDRSEQSSFRDFTSLIVEPSPRESGRAEGEGLHHPGAFLRNSRVPTSIRYATKWRTK